MPVSNSHLFFLVTFAGNSFVAALIVIGMGLLWLIPENKLAGLVILGVGLGCIVFSCCCYCMHRCSDTDRDEEAPEEVM